MREIKHVPMYYIGEGAPSTTVVAQKITEYLSKEYPGIKFLAEGWASDSKCYSYRDGILIGVKDE